MLCGYAIHDNPHHFGRDQLKHRNKHKQGHRAKIATPFPAKVPA
ncbi:Uncharacterised protein [Salmonella enterica subsp. enterica serovar Bovismorbificans]|uniref:Uncharacterized protein n=1 Tax=Salmonella enterica subsp. enterica serovar Bovismorbificans TaxID=58097 RepID=A0A655DQ85_SALET|nr:Uncharacterised protein [Salmonella enterica subsp. enterica serovar Bovismorbificans]CPR49148.1 Uncharacterised protein [Salmonella enterica subsp. enterica serovar Bovismorbificans]